MWKPILAILLLCLTWFNLSTIISLYNMNRKPDFVNVDMQHIIDMKLETICMCGTCNGPACQIPMYAGIGDQFECCQEIDPCVSFETLDKVDQAKCRAEVIPYYRFDAHTYLTVDGQQYYFVHSDDSLDKSLTEFSQAVLDWYEPDLYLCQRYFLFLDNQLQPSDVSMGTCSNKWQFIVIMNFVLSGMCGAFWVYCWPIYWGYKKLHKKSVPVFKYSKV